MRVIFVTGLPYAGKTHLARALAQRLGLEYACPGDWLRIQRDRPSPLGHYIRTNYNYECLDPLVSEFVATSIQYAVQLCNGIVVDGFPRTPFQAQLLPRISLSNRFIVIDLGGISRQEAVRRALLRQWTPPHGSLVVEADDDDDYASVTPEQVVRRYDVYDAHASETRIPLEEASCLAAIDASLEAEQVLARAIEILAEKPGILIPNEPLTAKEPLVAHATAMETATILDKCQCLVGLDDKRRRFVGAHPMSLQREHLQQIQKHPYLVSRKLDGDRVLGLVFMGRIWIVMRNLVVWRSRWCTAFLDWDLTMLDCEWIERPKTSLCVIDCVACKGDKQVMNLPILARLEKARHLLPLLCAILLDGGRVFFQGYYDFADLRFLVQVSRRRAVYTTASRKFQSPAPENATDGLVFTPQKLPYKASRDPNLLKWKDAKQNTVDVFHQGGADDPVVYVRDSTDASAAPSSTTIEYNGMRLVSFGILDEPRAGTPAILECLPSNLDRRFWHVVKVRQDRIEPNASWVAQRVCESIREDITLAELCNLEGVR